MITTLNAVRRYGIVPTPWCTEYKPALQEELRRFARSLCTPGWVKVNCSSIASEIAENFHNTADVYHELQRKSLRVLPGRECMWFDFQFGEEHFGVSTVREQADEGWLVNFRSFVQIPGANAVGWLSQCIANVDQKGHLKEVPVLNHMYLASGDEMIMIKDRLSHLVIFHALARLNCSNVTIRPISNSKGGCPHAPVNPKRMSEMHEIVLTSTPKTISGGNSIFERDWEEIRFHIVRGHFRRKPNAEETIWVPEYGRGNPDLGTVVSSYRIQ